MGRSKCKSEGMGNSDDLVDRISDLPDSLKELILECLPLSDAIKTSELSPKWRHAWKRMGGLVFDDSFLETMGTINDARLIRIVERILLAHQGTLEFFYLDIPLRSNLNVSGWFIALARKEVQQLSLYGFNDEFEFCLPSYFFEFGGLTHLSLGKCELKLPSNFQGFPNLVKCHLEGTYTSSNELAVFISKCPRLYTLSFVNILEIFSEPIEINSPNLRTLIVNDYISGMIKLCTPCLTVVSLKMLDDLHVLHTEFCSSFELLSSFPRIRKLTLDFPLLKPFDAAYPINLGNKLVALKMLSLGQVDICCSGDVSFMFCLIRSAPILKTLNIHIYEMIETEDEVAIECMESEVRKRYNLDKLLEVKISVIIGLKCELMLVKSMLSNCPLLNTLHIEARKDIEIAAEKEMAWELNRCCRLSRKVELTYSTS